MTVPTRAIFSSRKAGKAKGAIPNRVVAQNPSVCVNVWTEELILPTYLPAAPDRNPMFLEKRVYQGSSGKVYPLPFTDRIAEKAVEHRWNAVWIENEFLKVMVLPQIGGRIHVLQDKSTGYDLIYRQPVIKPALVALAGPWISGGIEFNWPQHHRPATFLPVDYEVEEHPDGSKTIWCSDHDPMARMKGMHGVCLHPGRAYLELKVRAFNRTQLAQTFLWWANVATRVHEAYQSFFPPDVYYVADHARRSMSEYPLCQGHYYGINYRERGEKGIPEAERPRQFIPPHCADGSQSLQQVPRYAPNDLSFYSNIPTPCSYMCMGSKEDFFGGYDYTAQAGIVHYANHHISPGKKQWTWGNHEFGYAWDRNLTDKDADGEYGPYIEIMAGVYTDNQPDFSFLQPGETRTWSQYWYPIQKIGPAQQANLDAALSVQPVKGAWRIGVAVTQMRRVTLRVFAGGRQRAVLSRTLSPSTPLIEQLKLGSRPGEVRVLVEDASGKELISYAVKPRVKGQVPPPATEPPAPEAIKSADELFITGVHLHQYRHATRCPTLYWREALRRDPLDARCNNALGLWHLRRGEFSIAEKHFRNSIERWTRRNANPQDGEPYYNLGLCLRYQGRDSEAYDALYKSAWNHAWVSAAYHALAEIDCSRGQWEVALEHLDRSLRFNAENTRALNLKVIALRKLGRESEAQALLKITLGFDKLDWWAKHLAGEPLQCDLQVALDLALDCVRAGLNEEAATILRQAAQASAAVSRRAAVANGKPRHDLPDQSWGALPLVYYYLGCLEQKAGNSRVALAEFKKAAAAAPDYCFPSRIEDIAILQTAIAANPGDARAPYYLGNLLYDRRRHDEAIAFWERAARLDSKFSVVWRNLGIAYFNIQRDKARARAAYEKAVKANPADARLLYERDQLWKRTGEPPARRLKALERRADLVRTRDDLSLELCTLYNQAGKHEEALKILSNRNFQPWEGGEGGPLGQYVRAHVALGRKALETGDPEAARVHFEASFRAPQNLGEAKHLLTNQSDIHYWLGCAFERLGNTAAARRHWKASATFKGDFQEMSVRAFSEMTFYSALSWTRLGRKATGARLLRELLAFGQQLEKATAKIEYFATSLPAMLLFEDDLEFRQTTTARFLQAQALMGLGKQRQAARLLKDVLSRDPNHSSAADHLGILGE